MSGERSGEEERRNHAVIGFVDVAADLLGHAAGIAVGNGIDHGIVVSAAQAAFLEGRKPQPKRPAIEIINCFH